MKSRRFSREVAMQVLFQWEAQSVLEPAPVTRAPEINPASINNFVGQLLANFYDKDKSGLDMPFISALLAGTLDNLTVIDKLLDHHSTKWKLSRMNAIDRAILRLASFELMEKKLSGAIIINEAVEIAKRYGGEQSPIFINGLLESVKQKLGA